MAKYVVENTGKIPCKRGPCEGQVLDYLTKDGVPFYLGKYELGWLKTREDDLFVGSTVVDAPEELVTVPLFPIPKDGLDND